MPADLRPDLVAELAAGLAVDVRDLEPAAVYRRIRGFARTGQLEAVCVALAAMVPVDRPVSELLAWTDALDARCDPSLDRSPAGCRSAHGTPARRNAGCAGAACVAAKGRYDAERYRRGIRRNRNVPERPGEKGAA